MKQVGVRFYVPTEPTMYFLTPSLQAKSVAHVPVAGLAKYAASSLTGQVLVAGAQNEGPQKCVFHKRVVHARELVRVSHLQRVPALFGYVNTFYSSKYLTLS